MGFNLGEIIHDLVSILQCKSTLLLQTPCRIDTDWQGFAIVLSFRVAFNVFKITDSPSKKLCHFSLSLRKIGANAYISAHYGCFIKNDDFEARFL